MALTAAPQRPTDSDAGRLLRWTVCVQRSAQPCLLLSIDGVLIAASEPAQALLGATAHPGAPLERWWHERSMGHGEAPAQASLLSRTLATGAPAHSVLSLDLPAGPTAVQVVAAPLHEHGAAAEALLAFLWPMPGRPGPVVRVP